MSTTTALLVGIGFLLAALVFAIWDYRKICRRSTQRFHPDNKAAPAATTNRSGAMTHGGKP